MKVKNKIRSILFTACAIFTAITFLMCGLGTWLSDGKLATTFPALLAFFAFSLLISVLNEVLVYKKLHIAVRILIHYLGSIVSFYGIFVHLGAFSAKVSGTLIMLIVFTLVYAAVALALLLIKYAIAGAKRDSGTYETQFNFEE